MNVFKRLFRQFRVSRRSPVMKPGSVRVSLDGHMAKTVVRNRLDTIMKTLEQKDLDPKKARHLIGEAYSLASRMILDGGRIADWDLEGWRKKWLL